MYSPCNTARRLVVAVRPCSRLHSTGCGNGSAAVPSEEAARAALDAALTAWSQARSRGSCRYESLTPDRTASRDDLLL